MNLLIAGSRILTDKTQIFPLIYQGLTDLNISVSSISTIVSGTANGMDKNGEDFAIQHHINIKRFEAQWNDLSIQPCKIKYNKFNKPYNSLAGFNRNEDMGQFADAGIIIVLNNSPGSLHMIKIMQNLSKPLWVKYLFR